MTISKVHHNFNSQCFHRPCQQLIKEHCKLAVDKRFPAKFEENGGLVFMLVTVERTLADGSRNIDRSAVFARDEFT